MSINFPTYKVGYFISITDLYTHLYCKYNCINIYYISNNTCIICQI